MVYMRYLDDGRLLRSVDILQFVEVVEGQPRLLQSCTSTRKTDERQLHLRMNRPPKCKKKLPNPRGCLWRERRSFEK